MIFSNEINRKKQVVMGFFVASLVFICLAFWQFGQQKDLSISWIEIPQGKMHYSFWVALGGSVENIERKIEFDQPFYLSKHRVTNSLWRTCVADGGCLKKGNLPELNDFPVTGVSWLDAHNFINWYRKETGENVRLPTEEEWVYAAKMGTPYKTKLKTRFEVESNQVVTYLIGTNYLEKVNEWGVAGMSNTQIWEWTLSCYEASLREYQINKAVETLKRVDHCPIRVLQGVARAHAPNFAHNGNNAMCVSGETVNLMGFRLLLEGSKD